MTCSVCEYYYLRNRKSPCGCSYGNHQMKDTVSQNKNANDSHQCTVCKIKVSGSLRDCTEQPMCNGCYNCEIVFGYCIGCN